MGTAAAAPTPPPPPLRSPALTTAESEALALEMLSPGGSPAGRNEDAVTFAEGVDEAAVVVMTIRAGGIDFKFRLRQGLRAARRKSTTERARRAFLQFNKNWNGEKGIVNGTKEVATHLLTSVARKYTSSGASIQLMTCFRPELVRDICAIFGFPFICKAIQCH